MRKTATIALLGLLLTTFLPLASSDAQGPAPQTLSFCLKLTPAGPNMKPPVLAQVSAGNKCETGFTHYDFPTPQAEIDSLNALLIGDFNAGLALGVYSSINQLKKPSPTPKAK
jgi:hypothetical protein